LVNPSHSADGLAPAPFAKAKEQHMKKILIASTAIFASAESAVAHTGEHGLSFTQGAFHVLTQPDHLAMIVAVAAVLGFLAYRRGRRSV
jgi:hydrogenase/urease accessory protein HupE